MKLGPVVDKSCFLDVRKSIVVRLYRECLIEISEDEIAIAEYYAVHYYKKYCIGRALSIPNSIHIKMKSLHNATDGKFEWPRQDDIDEVHISSIFHGSVKVGQCYPFTVPKKHELEKIFNSIH